MQDKYSELQQRFAIVTERNRANIERKNELLNKAKEKHGCANLEELEAKHSKEIKEREELKTSLERDLEVLENKLQKVESALQGEG